MIYLYCPAHIKTGGPEAIYQLSHKLNLLGFPVEIFLYNIEPNRPLVPDDFLKYKSNYAEKVYDSEENIVIMPEILIDSLLNFKYCKKIIWWLSVDFSKFTDASKEFLSKDERTFHFVQSEYAREYVTNIWNVIPNRIFHLSDYTSVEFLNAFKESSDYQRKDIIVFNPLKGINHTIQLISNSDSRVLWRPLKNLTTNGMKSVLNEAKVYVDFGGHPGKDRIPREAALCGCCVITNTFGAAKNHIDIAIPDKYKLGEDVSLEDSLNIIYETLSDFKTHQKDFDNYRLKSQMEFITFEQDIITVFSELCDVSIPFFMDSKTLEDIILNYFSTGDYINSFKHLVYYRYYNFEQTFIIYLLESYTRYELGEFPESEYFALQSLKIENNNSESYLLLSKINLKLNNFSNALTYCKQALLYSDGRPDKQDIISGCQEIINLLK